MKEEVIDGINYLLDEENLTAEVAGGDGCKGDIVIPETVKFNGVSYRVTSIGDSAFWGCSSLTEITIPDSVVNIGCEAFHGCDSLKQKPAQEIEINKVTYRLLKHNHLAKVVSRSYSEDLGVIDILSEFTYEGVVYRVTSIGEGVFCDCESLTAITIPRSVISIGERAFCGCDSLTEIVVEEGNPVYDSRKNCNAIIEKATNTLICGCQSTIIPDSVTCIGDEAFGYCYSLISITIPESVTSIGNSAFCFCESLSSITIPESVTSIGNSAFCFCESLSSITIPESVTSIGNYAFYNCKSLTSITIPESVTSIGESAFQDCKALTSVTIPSSVKSIGEGGTFHGCTSLKLVQWNAVNCIIDENSNGSYCPPFGNLSSIKNFKFGNNVKFIPACLCCGLSGLTSILIPESVTSIGANAFNGCTSLKIISIPSNAIIIEDGVFSECKSLYVIRYRGTVEQCIGRYRCWDHWFHAKTIYCTDGDVEI